MQIPGAIASAAFRPASHAARMSAVAPLAELRSRLIGARLARGVAFGLGFSALSLAATSGVADHEQGLAASLFQTSFQVGGAVVLAVVTAVVDAGGASQVTSAQATLGAYRPALAVITNIGNG